MANKEAEVEVVKPKLKSGRKTLTANQEQFCKMVAIEGIQPLEAMLTIFPNRKGYSVGNQNRLVREMQNNPRIKARIEELFLTIRENEVLGNLYNFDIGVRLLANQIKYAQDIIAEGKFSEALHRIILTSVQELNRMYGFNIIDRNGNTGGTVNVTFVNMKKPEEE